MTGALALGILVFLTLGLLLITPAPVMAAADSAPEAVMEGFSAVGLTRNDTHIFVGRAGSSPETCLYGGNVPQPVLQRANPAGGVVTSLLEQCHFNVSGMAADADYVFFRQNDSTIKRAAVNGSEVITLVANSGNCCGLAIDETHVYWARRVSGQQTNAIYRLLKTGGPVEVVVLVPNDDNIYWIRDLVVDETHVYWVDGKQGNSVLGQPGQGTVRKAPKGGGGFQTLAGVAEGIQHPLAIAIDETHVYWSEKETARARRVGKNGGAVTNYNGVEPGLRSEGVGVADGYVYWFDSDLAYAGRIRRAPVGGGPVVDLAVGLLGLKEFMFTDTHVYWAQHGGIYRLPYGTGAVAVDYTISGIEVTQTIQDANNSVPLVAEKHTLVRVYPQVDIYTGQRPKVRLRAFRNGVEVAGSPLLPVNPSVPVFTHEANRYRLEHSFNFKLPSDWRSGVLTLEAEINYDNAVAELNKTNNTRAIAINFHHKKPLCVEMVQVYTHGFTASVSDPGFSAMVDWLQAAYPVPTVLIDPGGMIKKRGSWYSLMDDSNKVLSRIGWYRLWHEHNQWQQCGAAHFYGMVHEHEISAGGLGYRPGWSAWGVMATHGWNQTVSQAAPWYAPHGGAILAHEIGHNRDRKHVNCGDPDGIDLTYPYNPCDIAGGFPGSHMGYFYYKDVVIGGLEAGDLMSYAPAVGKPKWISNYTYEAIFDKIPDASVAAAMHVEPAHAGHAHDNHHGEIDQFAARQLAQALIDADEILLVSALVTPTHTTASYEELAVVPAGTIVEATLINTAMTTWVSDEGEYTLRLLDAADAVVGELRFHVHGSHTSQGNEPEGDSFVLAMPWVPGTARVVLLQEGAEVAQRPVGTDAPRVTVMEPNGGESYAGSLTVRWAAETSDNAPQTYLVQYSHDNGKTWRVAADDLTNDALDIDEHEVKTLVIDDVSHLPGTNGHTALVRVFANNGVLTGSDVSDEPFSLRMQPPHVHIRTPGAGSVVAHGDTVVLLGYTFDVEDGTVADAGLSWTMDGAPAGSGYEVAVNGLALGKHTVSLTAIDSGQMWTTVEHDFFVRKQYCEEPSNRVDVVFVVDNSAPMHQHAQSFCNGVSAIVDELTDMGLDVHYDIYDVLASGNGAQASACAIGAVRERFGGQIDHPADWGQAVVSVANHNEWREATARLIVPVTNQGPEDGNPTQDPGSDRDALEAAIQAALANGATVSPLLMPPADSFYFLTNVQMAQELADATGGVVMQWGQDDPSLGVVLQDVAAQQVCAPDGATITPQVAVPGQEVCVVGAHLRPGTTVEIGNHSAPDATMNGDGAAVCFTVPVQMEIGEQTVEIGRPGLASARGAAQLMLTVATPEQDPGGELPDDDLPDEDNDPAAYDIYLPRVER